MGMNKFIALFFLKRRERRDTYFQGLKQCNLKKSINYGEIEKLKKRITFFRKNFYRENHKG